MPILVSQTTTDCGISPKLPCSHHICTKLSIFGCKRYICGCKHTYMIRNIHMKHPKFHHFWISRDSDVINVISRIVRNQLRLSGMFLVVSETATHASRLQSTVQIAPRGDSGYISGHLDVGVSRRHDRRPTNGAFAINCLR